MQIDSLADLVAFGVLPAAIGFAIGPAAAKNLWTIFASANQLLASLTLLAATMWFVRNRRPCWMTAVPMVFMMGVSAWALGSIFTASCAAGDVMRAVATGFLLLLAAVLVVLAVRKASSSSGG